MVVYANAASFVCTGFGLAKSELPTGTLSVVTMFVHFDNNRPICLAEVDFSTIPHFMCLFQPLRCFHVLCIVIEDRPMRGSALI
jgi:hypothetical protein